MTQNWRDWLRQQKDNQRDSHWNFNKFKIECVKCNSKNVEINGAAELEEEYYPGESSLLFDLLVKCHNCGAAMIITENGFGIEFGWKQ